MVVVGACRGFKLCRYPVREMDAPAEHECAHHYPTSATDEAHDYCEAPVGVGVGFVL